MFNVIPEKSDSQAGEIFNALISKYVNEISELRVDTGLTSALERAQYTPDEDGTYTMSISELLNTIATANQGNSYQDFSRMSTVYSFVEVLSEEFLGHGINPDEIDITFGNGEEASYITYTINPYEAICEYVLQKEKQGNQSLFLMDFLSEGDFRNKVIISSTETLKKYENKFDSLLRASAYVLQKRFSPLKQSFIDFLGLDETNLFVYSKLQNGQIITDPIFTKLFELSTSIDEGTNTNLKNAVQSSNRGTRSISEIRNLINYIEASYSVGQRDDVIERVLRHYHPNIELRGLGNVALKIEQNGNTHRSDLARAKFAPEA